VEVRAQDLGDVGLAEQHEPERAYRGGRAGRGAAHDADPGNGSLLLDRASCRRGPRNRGSVTGAQGTGPVGSPQLGKVAAAQGERLAPDDVD
jgi:hypothetical protein